MPEPITALITGYVVANAPGWIGSAIIDKGTEKLIDKGQDWLSEPKQQRHLEQVLKKAIQGGLKKFKQRKERDQYKDILKNLFEPGEHSAALLQEAMLLFTLSDTPDLNRLNEIYNQSLRSRNLSQSIPPTSINAAPYLARFFDSLIIELYNDACFKSQISDVIRTRAAMLMPQQLADVNTTLQQIHKTLKDEYTE